MLCTPPGDLPDPGIKPESLTSPALADGFFTPSVTWKAHSFIIQFQNIWLVLFYKKMYMSLLVLSILQGSFLFTVQLSHPYRTTGNHHLCWLLILSGVKSAAFVWRAGHFEL